MESEDSKDLGVDEVREMADRILAGRSHSESELCRKLLDRDVPRRLAEEVCGRLVDEGVLDDTAFAIHQARILRDQCWGPRQIRRKLRKHGVDDDVCDAALSEVGTQTRWLRRAYERFESKFGSTAEAMSHREKQKAFRHLKHRGYEGWTARRIVLDGYEPDDS